MNTDVSYVIANKVDIFEDHYNEFKSHRVLCIEELPPWCETDTGKSVKRSKQPISKTICAMLNTGRGGRIYLGIQDNRKVMGIHLTSQQKHHFVLSLHDTLSRFQPVVPPSRVKVRFVPVSHSAEKPPSTIEKEVCPSDQKAHLLRTAGKCWCDMEATPTGATVYVVELLILPWQGEYSESGLEFLHPYYQNEEGLCYMRRQASNVHFTIQDIKLATEHLVYSYYKKNKVAVEQK